MSGLGSRDLARYHKTRTPPGKTAAIRAKCGDCMANYADGRVDCIIPECLLYPFMPYTAENMARRGMVTLLIPSTIRPETIEFGRLGRNPAIL